MKQSENIRGVLPPSFGAWYQLLRRVNNVIKNTHEQKEKIVWTEMHPAGLSQGYEFTLDEIKAKALDEFIALVKDFDPQGRDYHYDIYCAVSARFLEPLGYEK